MKKQAISVTLFLICAMIFTMAACGHKSYASLEEWYADNPSEKLEKMNFSEGSSTFSMGLSVEENVLIYKMNYGTRIFGNDELTNKLFTAMFDKAFIEDKERNNKIINQLADKSGIDASLISLRFEIYNPGETKPCYQKTYPE